MNMDDSGIEELGGWSPCHEALQSFWEEGTAAAASKKLEEWRSRGNSPINAALGKKRAASDLEDFHYAEKNDCPETPSSQVKRRRISTEQEDESGASEGNLQDSQSVLLGETLLLCTEEYSDPMFSWKPLSVPHLPDRERAQKAFQVDHMGFIYYVTDIYLHKRSTEINYHPVDCLANQPQISPGMRALLVDWLTKVQKQFQFCVSTLFQAVNIIDRFLVTTPISRDCFQLLGITALLIAGKQEEVYPPEISELVRLCCDTYTKEQVRQLELLVLKRLNWCLVAPTAHFFLEYHSAERIHSAPLTSVSVEQCRQTRALGRYILELILQDYSLCQQPPSLLAVLTLEVADEMLSSCTRLGSLYAGGYSSTVVDECLMDLRLLSNGILSNCDIDDICSRYTCLHDCEDY